MADAEQPGDQGREQTQPKKGSYKPVSELSPGSKASRNEADNERQKRRTQKKQADRAAATATKTRDNFFLNCRVPRTGDIYFVTAGRMATAGNMGLTRREVFRLLNIFHQGLDLRILRECKLQQLS
jgi:hypothetical protein